MENVLLVNVPFYRFLGTHYNAINLGLGYVASSLNEVSDKYNTYIYNADFGQGYKNLTAIFDGYISYKEYFNNENHIIWEEVVDTILNFNPSCVGYFCYTANLKSIDIISKKIRAINKDIVQIVGGPHVSLDTNIQNKLKYIDIFHSGFGEFFLEDRHFNGFDNIPFPEKEKIWGISENQNSLIDRSYIITSRGCPFSCNFCASPNICHRKVFFRNIDSVIEEVRILKDKYGINNFYILDDTFTLKKSRVLKLLDKLAKENIVYKCNTRLDCLDDDICYMMKKSGCIEAKVGVESGSERMLKIINKKESKEDMINGIKLLKKNNISITAYLMVGFPQETDEDVLQTIDFAKKIEANKYSLSVFSPYFGSKIFEDLKENGFDFGMEHYELFYHQSPDPIANKKLSKKVLKEYFKLGDL